MSFRVTYATLTADDDELHAAYDRGIDVARGWLGAHHPFVIDGEPRAGDPAAVLEARSPSDHDVLIGTFASAGPADVRDAVAAAHGAQPAWAATPWPERVAVLERAADLVSARRAELAALMTMEVGKNRLEALGDVEESADLIRYYCHQMAEHDGFAVPMARLSPAEATYDVMRPYGVWAVISPFNFPMALAAGPVGAALVAGNAVVLKPAEQGVLTGLRTAEILWEAGVPAGALHVLTGPGETVGAALVRDPGVDGITFTGSYAVGMEIFGAFSGSYPKPAICEMGGKNPVIVTRNADLDLAAAGTARSAFGLSGQKCSAASRAYVDATVADGFVDRLAAAAAALVVGDPLDRASALGPVIDTAAVLRYEQAVAEAHARGRVRTGGTRIDTGDLARGNFVAPTVVTDVPRDSWIWSTELFVPLIAVDPVDSLDQAIDRANATPLGLTAGCFSTDAAEVDHFLDRIHAGVVYVNRAAGATTGAWPGVQPFGGWKGSGTSGKAGGGPYYLQQYLREQSRTVVERSEGRMG
jgi:1-pyrroline-5-carboxylate dehydrogenase